MSAPRHKKEIDKKLAIDTAVSSGGKPPGRYNISQGVFCSVQLCRATGDVGPGKRKDK